MTKRFLVFLLVFCFTVSSIGVSVYADASKTDNRGATRAPAEELAEGEGKLKASAETDVQRYTVLVLDTSATAKFYGAANALIYTADTALEYVKAAAKKFIGSISTASGANYVAVVAYRGSTASVVSPFSRDMNSLDSAVNGLTSSGTTRNVAAGFREADTLLGSVTEQGAIKNVVLFTTGMTNDGNHSYSGQYDGSTVGSEWKRLDTRIPLYAYANVAYSTSVTLKTKATIYTIGLFQTLEEMPAEGLPVVQLFKLCAQDWATSANHFYDVKDPEELAFVFGEVVTDIVKKTGDFKYPGAGRDYTGTYYYDDAYFRQSSTRYNEHLATMSLCLELSAWASAEVGNSYPSKSRNAAALLNALGFKDFAANGGYLVKPTKDSIGAVAAHKPLNVEGKNYTLIALAIRGGGYESEWASNFTVGKTGHHQGFGEARDQVVDFLKKYISDHNIKGDLKLWITGYSRAAATANMVAGKINEGVSFSNCALATTDMYAYTFETPAGYVRPANAATHANIFNIINESDPVTKVAPAAWSFGRYGIDKRLPSRETRTETEYAKNLQAMLARYYALQGVGTYKVDDFRMQKINFDPLGAILGKNSLFSIIEDTKNPQSQNAFLNNYLTIVAKDFLKNRNNYVTYFQNGVREFCGIYFGSDPDKTAKLMVIAPQKLRDNIGGIIVSLIWAGEKGAYLKVAELLRASLKEAGITGYDQKVFDKAVVNIADLILAVAANHPNLTTTLIKNTEGIGQAHYPEVCLAWMQSMDSYYTAERPGEFSSGKYRIVRINCPVNVEVRNAGGQLVAAITGDVPQNLTSIVAAVNEDGEKLVYLPTDGSYTIQLIATGDGVMSYSLNEYDPQAGEVNRLVNYYDIPITKGQQLTGSAPAYSEPDQNDETPAASSTAYGLSKEGAALKISNELSGPAATSAWYYVQVTPNNPAYGIVQGAGSRQKGSFAQVTAVANGGYKFAGWLKNGKTLVSSAREYRFRVDGDVSVTAKFVADASKYKTDKKGRPVLTAAPTPQVPLNIAKTPAKAFTIEKRTWTNKRITSGFKVKIAYVVKGKVYAKTLKAGTDYKLSKPGKNKNIGKGTITLTGQKGSGIAGVKILSFKIVPKKPANLRLTAGKQSLKVTFNKVSKTQKITTYKVQYRLKGASKWKTKTIKVKLTGADAKKKAVSVTLKNLKSKRTYQVRVLAYRSVYIGYPTVIKTKKIK